MCGPDSAKLLCNVCELSGLETVFRLCSRVVLVILCAERSDMYAESFAGLVQAAADAGIPGDVLVEMEEVGVTSPSVARSMLAAGSGSEAMRAHLQALVGMAFGQFSPLASSTRAPTPTPNAGSGHIIGRKDIPVAKISKGGSKKRLKQRCHKISRQRLRNSKAIFGQRAM